MISLKNLILSAVAYFLGHLKMKLFTTPLLKRLQKTPFGHYFMKSDTLLLTTKQYTDDLELLMMEVAAWKKAKEIATRYYLVIDEDHIEDCLDSYRNWLHTRSRCIECKTHSFQIDQTTYQCYNCLTRWKVPASRMCNPRKTRIK